MYSFEFSKEQPSVVGRGVGVKCSTNNVKKIEKSRRKIVLEPTIETANEARCKRVHSKIMYRSIEYECRKRQEGDVYSILIVVVEFSKLEQ